VGSKTLSQGKKQFSPIILAGLLFLSMFPLLNVAGGGGGAGETSQWNAGTSSCVITAGNSQCSNSFTWPTPLSAVPCGGCSEATPTTATGGISDQTIIVSPIQENFWATGSDFGVAGRWVNMPAIQTEIFGDNGQHWLIEDWSKSSTADFVIDCPVASNNAAATLTVQYSTDTGATWNSIAASAININIGCAIGSPIDSGLANGGIFGTTFSIPAPAQITAVFLRIVGQNGGGIGDTPQFVYAYLLVNPSPVIIRFIFTASVSSSSATAILVIGKINVVQSSSTTVNWKMSAWICKTGGSGPC